MDLKTSAVEKTKDFWRKLQPFLPWASLIWGVISAFLMTRGYTSSFKLALYFIAVLAFPHIVHRLGRGLWQWLGLFSAQVSIQYVFLFFIPFLFFAQNWTSLTLTLLLSVIIFWDPWWEFFARKPWFFALQSLWGIVLGSSFLLGVLLPNFVEYFYLCLSLTLVFALHFLFRKVGFRYFHHPKVVIFSVLLVSLTQLVIPLELRLPYLAAWTSKPHFGFGVENRTSKLKTSGSLSNLDLKTALQSVGPLCCFSPIVAPPKFNQTIRHVWLINGEVVDTISLPAVLGQNDHNHSFHTYSCKNNFVVTNSKTTFECRIYISDSIYLSSVSLDIWRDEK